MALPEISLKLDLAAMPEDVRRWVAAAKRDSDGFYEAGLGLRYPKYVPSDPAVVHAAIAFLKKEGLLRGEVFCEWGSGFGVATGIAALLGMTAYGIEIEDELVDRSLRLAEANNITMEILQTDYLPEGFDESEGVGGKDLISPESRTTRGGVIHPPEYDGLDPETVDLFFVYPWPGQEKMMMDLFEAVASHGAILLLYLGEGEIAAFLRDEGDE